MRERGSSGMGDAVELATPAADMGICTWCSVAWQHVPQACSAMQSDARMAAHLARRCGRGRHSMAASSRSSCAAWAPRATGAASASRWTRASRVRCAVMKHLLLVHCLWLCWWHKRFRHSQGFRAHSVRPQRVVMPTNQSHTGCAAVLLSSPMPTQLPVLPSLPAHAESVLEAFVRLHEKGLVYRGSYMVNWSPGLQTGVCGVAVASGNGWMSMRFGMHFTCSGLGCRDAATALGHVSFRLGNFVACLSSRSCV